MLRENRQERKREDEKNSRDRNAFKYPSEA